jgi:hypothetical protein
MRSTHNAHQGVVMTSFGSTCPYFWLCLLFIWQEVQDFDSFSDGIARTFPVHHGSHCLIETGVPRVLKVMVIPTDCPVS